MKILQLKTGLFPDADTVGRAVETLQGAHDVTHMDIEDLSPDDEDAWGAVAAAVLAADMLVTL